MSAADLRRVFLAAVAAVEPRAAVRRLLGVEDGRLVAGEHVTDLAGIERILVIGAGKAGAGMAAAVEDVLGERVGGGLVVVKGGDLGACSRVDLVEAGHPLPDARGERAAARILGLARAADARTVVVCLLSGGASALLVAPAPGLTLEDKVATTRLLLASGADIAEVNTVRKHLSAVKGGRLAAAAAPAAVVSIVISDVVADRLDVIASGPTFPDGSTFEQAREVLGRRALLHRVPAAVRTHLERGALGLIPETPKPQDPLFGRVSHCLAGSNRIALEAAAASAGSLGWDTTVLSGEVQGEAREVARRLAGEARLLANQAGGAATRCLLSGGETTVTVTGRGTGGRNQELALAFALAVEGVPGVTLLSAGTDGIDGPTDVAGAIVDGETAAAARRAGLDPEAALRENDSHGFFAELGRRSGVSPLLVTGPTGTNVMDLQIVAVQGPGGRRHGDG